MLSLPQTTGYAMLALSCLRQAPAPRLLARAISRRTGIPLPYLSKILHALCGSGLVHGKRGYRGGFALSRPASAITLYDVAVAVQGPEPLAPCVLGLAACPRTTPCPTHAFWRRERRRIERHLRGISLADIAAFHARLLGSAAPPPRARRAPLHSRTRSFAGRGRSRNVKDA